MDISVWIVGGCISAGLLWWAYKRDHRAESDSTYQAADCWNQLHKDLGNFALTCNHCNGVAIPILATHDRYRCVDCQRQFANAAHKLVEPGVRDPRRHEYHWKNMYYGGDMSSVFFKPQLAYGYPTYKAECDPLSPEYNPRYDSLSPLFVAASKPESSDTQKSE